MLDISSALCHVGIVAAGLADGTKLQKGSDMTDKTILDEVIDIEEFAKRGEPPPLAKAYRIRVNGEKFIVEKAEPTGREILTIAGLTPPENHTLRVKQAGDRPRKVDLDDTVDLRKPGVEKFKALPRDQTEG